MVELTRKQWIDRYVAEMVRLGFDMQFSTECAEASADNGSWLEEWSAEEAVHEDLSCWSD